MSLSGDAIFVLTYCLFLTGAAWSFQSNASSSSIWVMSAAMLIDFLASILPVMNLKSIAINLPPNMIITAAILLGILVWLQSLGRDANPSAEGFQPQLLYVVMCIVLPVTIGLFVGFSLRFIERVLGVELGRGGGH